MRKVIVLSVLALLLSVLFGTIGVQADTDYDASCWGQASAAFAQTGKMGKHASQQPTPRAGLANLARYLYEEAGIGDGTLQGLGAYLVSIDPDLTVEACMD